MPRKIQSLIIAATAFAGMTLGLSGHVLAMAPGTPAPETYQDATSMVSTGIAQASNCPNITWPDFPPPAIPAAGTAATYGQPGTNKGVPFFQAVLAAGGDATGYYKSTADGNCYVIPNCGSGHIWKSGTQACVSESISTSLVLSPNPATPGQTITATFTMSSAYEVASANLVCGGSTLSTSTTSGSATFTVAAPATVTCTLTATNPGASSSSTATVTVACPANSGWNGSACAPLDPPTLTYVWSAPMTNAAAFTIPAAPAGDLPYSTMTVKAWGAGGQGGINADNCGASCQKGGGGGYASGVYNVTAGQVYYVVVGAGGSALTTTTNVTLSGTSVPVANYNLQFPSYTGGQGMNGGGGGGGWSGVLNLPLNQALPSTKGTTATSAAFTTAVSNITNGYLVIAGGGGGGGGGNSVVGGAGYAGSPGGSTSATAIAAAPKPCAAAACQEGGSEPGSVPGLYYGTMQDQSCGDPYSTPGAYCGTWPYSITEIATVGSSIAGCVSSSYSSTWVCQPGFLYAGTFAAWQGNNGGCSGGVELVGGGGGGATGGSQLNGPGGANPGSPSSTASLTVNNGQPCVWSSGGYGGTNAVRNAASGTTMQIGSGTTAANSGDANRPANAGNAGTWAAGGYAGAVVIILN